MNIGDYVEKEFILTNTYSNTLRIDILQLDGHTDYLIVSGDGVPITIPAKGTHNVLIRFTPNNEGIEQTSLLILHDSSTKQKVVKITGIGKRVPRISINERSYNFGLVYNNSNKNHDFIIQNDGTSDLSLNAFSFTGPNSSLFSISSGGSVPVYVAPGLTHTVTVQFSPLVNGNYTGILQISHNAVNDNNPLEINLEGRGVDVNPMIKLSEIATWDFGGLPSTLNMVQICEIENIGTDPLTVNSATLSTNVDFTVEALKDANGNVLNFPQVIPVSDKVFLFVKFAPQSISIFTDTLSIDHDGTNESNPLNLTLNGSAHQAQTKTWDVVTKTKETWTVPTNVTFIRIEVWGAEGGGIGYGVPGKGARMRGDFNVKPGDVLEIAVGEQGLTGGKGGGGGGGSFVALGTQPLIIAGGGGGSHSNNSNLVGQNGVITTTCTPYSSTGTGYTAGSGGGWSQDGANGTYGSLGGKSWSNGLIGGTCCTGGYSHWSRGDGGYGGGGGGSWAPGSAGGYNGGVSADSGGNQTPGGTGGGSINNGSNQDNTAGAQSGNGKIVISY